MLNGMAIQQFPPEVLEHIFVFLDGFSFSLSKQVCKSWYEVIKQMEVKKSLWRQFCIREIQQNVLEEILCFKIVSSADVSTDWTVVYKKWFQARRVKISPYWKKLINAFCSNPVTCIKFSGSWVITGHSNGCLCVWDCYSGHLCQKMLYHLKTITGIALVDLLCLGSYYGSEELPWAHHHLITISKDRYIRINSLLEPLPNSDIVLNVHGDILQEIKVFGSSFVVSSRDNTISLWNMKLYRKPFFHLEISFVRKFCGPPDIMMDLGFWHSDIFCISYAGRLKSLNYENSEWLEKKYFKESYSKNGPESIVSVTKAFLFRHQTVIMLTGDGKMIVSINEKQNQHYYLMKNLQTGLVSVSLHGTILALGGENGKLFIFDVSREDELMNLNLAKPNLALTLSEASIISIDISYDQDSPIIAAATTESLFIIKWYSDSNTHKEVKARDLSELFQSH